MAQHDQLHRYLFENYAVRGELVTVSETWKQILENHSYPQPVKTILGELLVATSLLTATLKFAGDITVQLQGDGPMSLAVINGNNRQQMRGVARVQGDIADDADLKTLVGNGYLVITITQKKVNVIRASSVWKAIRWQPVWKITSCVPNSCRPACSSVPAMWRVHRPQAVCCCRFYPRRIPRRWILNTWQR
jgi:molecular chaperone Hsp33